MFSKDKNVEAHIWEHVSFEEINPQMMHCIFFSCGCINNIQQDPRLFYNLESVLKTHGKIK